MVTGMAEKGGGSCRINFNIWTECVLGGDVVRDYVVLQLL